MTTDQATPRMTKEEAQDLATKLSNLDGQLGPNQQKFLRLAVTRLAASSGQGSSEDADVQGYDYQTGWYVAGFDYTTGEWIYEDDVYDNWGNYEGSYLAEGD